MDTTITLQYSTTTFNYSTENPNPVQKTVLYSVTGFFLLLVICGSYFVKKYWKREFFIKKENLSLEQVEVSTANSTTRTAEQLQNSSPEVDPFTGEDYSTLESAAVSRMILRQNQNRSAANNTSMRPINISTISTPLHVRPSAPLLDLPPSYDEALVQYGDNYDSGISVENSLNFAINMDRIEPPPSYSSPNNPR